MRRKIRFFKNMHVRDRRTGEFARILSGAKGKVHLEVLDPDSIMCVQAILTQEEAGKVLVRYKEMEWEEKGLLSSINQARREAAGGGKVTSPWSLPKRSSMAPGATAEHCEEGRRELTLF